MYISKETSFSVVKTYTRRVKGWFASNLSPRARRLRVICRVERWIEGGREKLSFLSRENDGRNPSKQGDRKRRTPEWRRTKGGKGMRGRRLLSGGGGTASRTVADIEWRKGERLYCFVVQERKRESRYGEIRVSCFDIQSGTKSCRFVRNVIARIGWLSSTWRRGLREELPRVQERMENWQSWFFNSPMIFQIMSAFTDILLLGGLDFGTCIDIFRFKDLFEFRGEERGIRVLFATRLVGKQAWYLSHS